MIKKASFLLFSVCILLIGLSTGCRTEPDLTGTPEVKFSTDVQRILSAKCNFTGCHGAGAGNKGLLTTYEDVMGFGAVKAGDAHKSKLYKYITGRTFEPMPPSGYTEVSAEEIKLIFIWIEQGAKNN